MDQPELQTLAFDQYQRYRICREIVCIFQEEGELSKKTVLDVGGYSQDAQGQAFLPITITFPEFKGMVLDVADCQLSGYIRGDGGTLPFRNEAFEVVTSMDTLEHIPEGQRDNFLKNLIRVSEKFLILSAPFDSEEVNQAERILFEFISRALKAEHQQLKEHLVNGLPKVERVLSLLNRENLPYCYFDGSYLNNFLLMMLVKHFLLSLPDSLPLHSLLDRYYNLTFFESDQRGPGYRKTLVIAKDQKNERILRRIEEQFASNGKKFAHLSARRSNIAQFESVLSFELPGQPEKIAELERIKESQVWRAIEFSRRISYRKLFEKTPLLKKAICTIKQEGISAFWAKTKVYLQRNNPLISMKLTQTDYEKWIKKHELTDERIGEIQREIEGFPFKPKISILMPVYNVDQGWLEKAIDSALNQIYVNWELCISDDASTKNHIRETLGRYSRQDSRIRIKYLNKNQGISVATNEALSLATGEFIALLDHDDELSKDALYENLRLLNQFPEADMIYSDEDKLGIDGKRNEPYFKPDWAPDTFLSVLYTCHLGVYRKSIVDLVGGFRKGYEGSQDSDLVLRISERTQRIFHIPKILYHWRKIPGSTAMDALEKPFCHISARKALTDYIARNKINGELLDGHFTGAYRIRRAIKELPKVAIIIPFRDHVEALKKCVESILNRTAYPNFEIQLVDNQSEAEESLLYLGKIKEHAQVRIWKFEKPFNFSAINNFAVSQISNEYLIFLNSDTEIISPEWITALLEFAQRKDVGAVGALLYYPNDTVQHAGIILMTGGGVAGHSHKGFPRTSLGYFGQIKISQNLSAITGACLMTKKSVFQEVGRFDENLAFAYNDVDFCLKVREKGYLVVYTPYAELYHYESLSRGYDDTPQKKAGFLKEEKIFQEKWKELLGQGDPYYNSNLTRKKEDFSISI